MSAPRETVMEALFVALQALPGLAVSSRRNRAPEQIGPNESPALLLLEHGEEFVVRSVALPPIQKLKPKVVFYNDIGDQPNVIPAVAINQLIDALVRILKPGDPSNLFTLGGLVDSIVIEGQVVKAPGDITGKSVAIVPLTITLP